MTTNNLLVLDADGVMLDYNAAYPKVWKAAFGEDLVRVRENCYHAHTEYGVELSDPLKKKMFYSAFDDRVWSDMPALAGAVEGAQLLAAAGYRLICVTSMPTRFQGARHQNLQKLGFPIERVIATGRKFKSNPKLAALAELQPAAFVDDLLHNFDAVPDDVHKALIDYGNVDSPNLGLEDKFSHHSVHGSLLDFARHWLQSSTLRKAA